MTSSELYLTSRYVWTTLSSMYVAKSLTLHKSHTCMTCTIDFFMYTPRSVIKLAENYSDSIRKIFELDLYLYLVVVHF